MRKPARLRAAALAVCIACVPTPSFADEATPSAMRPIAAGAGTAPEAERVPGVASLPVAEPRDYRMADFRAPVPTTLAGARVVDTPAAADLWRGGARFIDVLPRPPRPVLPAGTLWRPPQRDNIPGSIWLVNTGFGALSPEAEAYFRAGIAKASAGDRAAPLVFYCLTDCWMSWNAAKRAVAAGYTAVHWYPYGSDGWAAAGLPLARAEPEPGEPLRPDQPQ